MEDQAGTSLSNKFSELSSDDLMAIWKKHDVYQYSGADFEAIRGVLEGRGFHLEPIGETQNKLKGIGGWLIFPAIAVIALVVLNVSAMALGIVALEDAPSRFESILKFEISYHVLMLIYTTALAILFFKKKTIVPKMFITFLAINLLFVTIDSVWILDISERAWENTGGPMSIVQGVIGAAVWIPYWLVSKRVKLTFVE